MFSSQQIIIDIGKYIWKKTALLPKESLNIIYIIIQTIFKKRRILINRILKKLAFSKAGYSLRRISCRHNAYFKSSNAFIKAASLFL